MSHYDAAVKNENYYKLMKSLNFMNGVEEFLDGNVDGGEFT